MRGAGAVLRQGPAGQVLAAVAHVSAAVHVDQAAVVIAVHPDGPSALLGEEERAVRAVEAAEDRAGAQAPREHGWPRAKGQGPRANANRVLHLK